MHDNFDSAVSIILQNIVDSIEANDPDYLYDIDFDGDIVTITKNDQTWVVNKHSAAKEIWLSSPVSGPYHFAPLLWLDKKNRHLFTVLSKEFNINFESTK